MQQSWRMRILEEGGEGLEEVGEGLVPHFAYAPVRNGIPDVPGLCQFSGNMSSNVPLVCMGIGRAPLRV